MPKYVTIFSYSSGSWARMISLMTGSLRYGNCSNPKVRPESVYFMPLGAQDGIESVHQTLPTQ